MLDNLFADRVSNIHKSFIREILKVTQNPQIISFAGGLPNPKFFPVEEVTDATMKVLRDDGHKALQYSTTEGHPPLREFIAQRYFERFGLKVSPDQILITSGSQQGLDLIGKLFLNEGDHVILERPSYLGAIQAFSFYQPAFHMISLAEDGLDTAELETWLGEHTAKLFYTVPNFQNPSGLSYNAQKRRETANLLAKHNVILIEDDPYGELRFAGEPLPPIRSHLEDLGFLLGSFSKIVSPGLRLGWICAPQEAVDKLIVAKQAADLHSNYLSQRIIYQYLQDNNLNDHIVTIKAAYKKRAEVMIAAIKTYFPPEVSYTQPQGGMFVWLTLPPTVSALDLFEQAKTFEVAFVPGSAFYVDGGGQHTLRLNFSNTDEARIEEGLKRLAKATKTLMTQVK